MNVGIRLLRLSAVYLAAGGLLGMYMGVTKDFALSSVHAHIALLGWIALAVSGLLYLALPACGADRLARIHFWGHSIGLPIMMASLSLHAYGIKSAEAVVGISSTVVVASLLAFAVNVGLNANRKEASRAIGVRETRSCNEAI